MYVTAHRVRRHREGQPDQEGVNAFVHVHGPGYSLVLNPARVPDDAPGDEVVRLRDATVEPGGNEVRSYLDLVAPDGTDEDSAVAAIAQVRSALAEGSLPLVIEVGSVMARFGCQFGLYSVRREEFDTLAKKVLSLWRPARLASAA